MHTLQYAWRVASNGSALSGPPEPVTAGQHSTTGADEQRWIELFRAVMPVAIPPDEAPHDPAMWHNAVSYRGDPGT
jgi:hypothetical protein